MEQENIYRVHVKMRVLRYHTRRIPVYESNTWRSPFFEVKLRTLVSLDESCTNKTAAAPPMKNAALLLTFCN